MDARILSRNHTMASSSKERFELITTQLAEVLNPELIQKILDEVPTNSPVTTCDSTDQVFARDEIQKFTGELPRQVSLLSRSPLN